MQQTIGQLGGQIAGAVELAVSRATHPLTMSMDNFIQGTTREQVDGIQRIVNQFVKQMDTSMNGKFTAFSDAVDRMNHSMQDMQQSMKLALETIKEMALDKEMSETGNTYRETMEALVRNNDETMEKLTQAIANLQNAIDTSVDTGQNGGSQG